MTREITLKLIDETLEAMDRFNRLDQQREIISIQELESLNKEKENLTRLRNKLATDELEVAVVGLEKAGKSKFSSAFVGMDGLFPSADERCTFTSTALRHGNQNEARVEFYTKQGFYDKVSGMLSDLEYPKQSFDTLEEAAFQRHFDSLRETNRGLYDKHSSKTETDLVDIIQGKAKIQPLLGRSEQVFSDLSSEELRTYITDKHISRAVKSVTFYAVDLAGLENIVLYDVPGFDSPTLVHINQTIEKLKQVDAIVMIKDIKMPSLKGNEVDILVRNSDMDGITLSDKLFVFGSKADTVDNERQLQSNKQTLLGDLSRSLRKSFDSKRIMTGCLDKKYEHLLTQRGGKTELEELKTALRIYNNNERADILSKRINRSVEEIKSVLRAIVDRTQVEISDRSEESSLVLDLFDESRKSIDRNLSHFINPIKASLLQEKNFTKQVIEGIEHCIPALDQTFIEDTLHDIQSSDTRNVINFVKLNHALRDRLTTRIKDNVTQLVLGVSQKDANRIQSEIQNIVLRALGIEKNHPKFEELNQSVREFIDSETASVSIRDAAFKPLIERFIVDLIDTMIQQPLGSDARLARFREGKSDLYMLAMFSQGASIDLPYRSPLVAAVLTQKNGSESHIKQTEEYQAQFRRAFPKIGEGKSDLGVLVQQLVSTLAGVAISRSIPMASVILWTKEIIQSTVHQGEGDVRILKSFQELLGRMGASEKDLVQSEDAYLKYLLNNVTQARNESEVRAEIVNDLNNLVHLFKDCVVSAMNLELPFISAVTLLVDRSREVFQDRGYREFVGKNVRKIRINDFERIDNQNANRETRSRLLKEMRGVLLRLEQGVYSF